VGSEESSETDYGDDEEDPYLWTDVAGSFESTKRGIHMGLGPSWIVLSLLNIAAGMYASDDIGSFRVCGDDLIAIWTPTEVDKYEWFLTQLGMRINTSKSFYGEQGVFCELLICRTGERTAESRDCGHIAEAAGSKEKAQKSHHPLEVAHALRSYKCTSRPLLNLARVTRRRIGSRYSKLSGPLNTGGNGFGSPVRQVLFVLTHGAVSFCQQKPKPWRLDLESAKIKDHERKSGIKYITRLDAAVALECEDRVRRLVQGEHPSAPPAVKPMSFRRRVAKLNHTASPTWGQAREIPNLSGKVRRFMRQFRKAADTAPISPKAATQLCKISIENSNTGVIAIDDVLDLAEEYTLLSHGRELSSEILSPKRQGSRRER
jgi:hypothetical protein